jgi:hypothetical protein
MGRSTFSQCKVLACNYGQPRCCGRFWGGVAQANASLAQRQSELSSDIFLGEATGLRALEVEDVDSCG